MTRPSRRPLPISCGQAVEAVSARLDGESYPVAEADLETHLENCPACLRFQSQAQRLRRQVAVRAARRPPRPAAPVPPLAAPAARLRGRRAPHPSAGGRRALATTAHWAAFALPACLLATAITLGAAGQPRLIPTKPASPCTAGLVRLEHRVP